MLNYSSRIHKHSTQLPNWPLQIHSQSHGSIHVPSCYFAYKDTSANTTTSLYRQKLLSMCHNLVKIISFWTTSFVHFISSTPRHPFVFLCLHAHTLSFLFCMPQCVTIAPCCSTAPDRDQTACLILTCVSFHTTILPLSLT